MLKERGLQGPFDRREFKTISFFVLKGACWQSVSLCLKPSLTGADGRAAGGGAGGGAGLRLEGGGRSYRVAEAEPPRILLHHQRGRRLQTLQQR